MKKSKYGRNSLFFTEDFYGLGFLHFRGNIQGGKQRRRAVALVVVRLAGERPPIGQFQVP